MDFFKGLLENRILIAALVAWAIAQTAKAILWLNVNSWGNKVN